MAQSIEQRLERLRNRRLGTDRVAVLSEDARNSVLGRAYFREAWQDRASDRQPHTRWVLGAMQAVDDTYTRISIETAERVGKQLKASLDAAQRPVDFRLQGSVPLNIHIRGVSDVDLLTIDAYYLTYATGGSKDRMGRYTPDQRTPVEVLGSLRHHCARTLRDAYPAAKVDTSGSKAIKISGGSLARPVDVVPSHWHDTLEYQATLAEHDRGVAILDTSVPTTINNLPFKHIKLVADRCDQTHGGLRKAIRLCKHVKADLEAEGKTIGLSSFDLASIMYHADLQALASGRFFDLAILAETQRQLDRLYLDKDYARTLYVPDGTRKIFDSSTKFDGLLLLSSEMDRLLKAVWEEQNPYQTAGSGMLHSYRNALNTAVIQ